MSDPNPAAADDGNKRHVSAHETSAQASDGAGETATPQPLQAPASSQTQAQLFPLQLSSGPPPAVTNVAALIDLIEKHVRRMLVSEGGLEHSGRAKVLLRMSGTTLAHTDLLLSKTDSGWKLEADARSAEAFRAIQEFAPDLSTRFEQRALGDIEIEARWRT